MKKSELFTKEMLETFKFENPLNGCIMLAFITRNYNHLYFV